jgi:hypothetical protein
MHHPGLVDLHTHTTASDGSDPPDVHLGALPSPTGYWTRSATDSPRRVHSA